MNANGQKEKIRKSFIHNIVFQKIPVNINTMNKSKVPETWFGRKGSSWDNVPHLQVVRILENLLPEIATHSNSPSVLGKVCLCLSLMLILFAFDVQLSNLCVGLKKVGHLLETEHSEKLDRLQGFLTEICKDSAVDITLRLNILEIIELRSLFWCSNPQLERFYQEKIAHFEQRERAFHEVQDIKTKNFASALASRGDRSARSNIDEDDQLKFQTSVQDLFPNIKLRERECVVVDVKDVKEKLFLSSTNAKLVKDAKSCLSQFFRHQQGKAAPAVFKKS